MTLDLHVLSVLFSLSCLRTYFVLFVDHTLGFFEEVCRYASHGIHSHCSHVIFCDPQGVMIIMLQVHISSQLSFQ